MARHRQHKHKLGHAANVETSVAPLEVRCMNFLASTSTFLSLGERGEALLAADPGHVPNSLSFGAQPMALMLAVGDIRQPSGMCSPERKLRSIWEQEALSVSVPGSRPRSGPA